MTTATLPAPATPAADEGDWAHSWCCDPDLSLCGVDISDHEEAPLTSLDEVCPACIAAFQIGGPCAFAGCPNRTTA